MSDQINKAKADRLRLNAASLILQAEKLERSLGNNKNFRSKIVMLIMNCSLVKWASSILQRQIIQALRGDLIQGPENKARVKESLLLHRDAIYEALEQAKADRGES
jgi:hypothetical protein